MPKYLKFETDTIIDFICINEDHVLISAEHKKEPFKSKSIRLMNENEFNQSYWHLNSIEIKETEFIQAVGNAQAAVKNFIDKTRIS